MIQSRGQFGFYGAVFIFLASILLDVGYLAGQQVVQAQSLNDLASSVNVLLFFFVPWSVINLVDFYIVKKGRYDVRSFFTASGIYGGWRWVAIVPYLVALAAQVPFLDQTLYVGPMVKVLGGADISWIVGFVVAGAGYLISCRLAGGQAQLTAGEAQGVASS
jgi:purine-cytosine permease-like protein